MKKQIIIFIITVIFLFLKILSFAQEITIDFSKPIAKGNPMVFGGTQPRGLSDEQWDILQKQGFKFMRSQADLTMLVPCESTEDYLINKDGCNNPENWDWKNGIYGDNFAQRAIDRKMAVCLVIKNARWNRYDGSPDDEETVPRNFEVWQDIVTKIVNHYNGGITYIECFNEVDRDPQLLVEGSGMTQKEAYTKIVLTGIQAVHESDFPHTKIGGTAAAGFGFDELNWLLEDEYIRKNMGVVSFHYFDSPHYPHEKVLHLKKLLQKYNLEIDVVRSSYTPELRGDNPFNKPGTTQPEYIAIHIIGALKDGLSATGLWEIQNREDENDYRYWFDDKKTVVTSLLFELLSNEYQLGKGESKIFGAEGLNFTHAFGAINQDGELVGAIVNIEADSQKLNLNLKKTETKNKIRFTLIHKNKKIVYTKPLIQDKSIFQTEIEIPGNAVLGFKLTN